MKDLPAWLRAEGGHRGACDLGLGDWFWLIIDQIRANPDSAEALLSDLSSQELARFYYAYREATDELYGDYRDDERGWGENEILNASSWVVNQGEAFYCAVWEDLTRYPDAADAPFSDLSGLAAMVAKKRFGYELCG